jgi:subfamily B ATP-binding cassette protein HlyB/CyaB
VARVRELENVRHFLTDGALTLVIDVVFAMLFLAVLFWYSPKLTLIVLATVPVYVAVALIFTPIIHGRLEQKFNRGAENQAYLIESVTGVGTIKSLALEPRWTQTWDQQLTRFVFASLGVAKAGNFANALVQLTSQLTTVAILWVGAGMVIRRELTVGELVAFNMLAGQVTGPILRLSGLWNEFQQFRVSMQRLGDIFTEAPEVQERSFRLPRIQGQLDLRGLHFRYPGQARDALAGVDLRVQAGEVVAVVGRSGSGKSTLASLLLGLYMPTQGRLMIDGVDITSVDAASLRSQVGIVPQECTLFSGTIRSNIALADPLAPIERVMQAARLAGAHEFIAELPMGYETPIGENGTGLSGGQRQRLAIARALITNPAILILDEATSALDQESERAIQANMHDIVQGRTVIVIAHRESAIRMATRVVMLDSGKLVEDGTLDDLQRDPTSAYARLFGHRMTEAEAA